LITRRQKGVVFVSMYHEPEERTGWSRTRWIVLSGLGLAIVAAVILVLVYTGGGGGGGGGGY
jgi:hypothetical protein